MKKYKIIAAIIGFLILAAVFFQCSGIGVSSSAQIVETKSGAVDTSTIPANSEFLKE